MSKVLPSLSWLASFLLLSLIADPGAFAQTRRPYGDVGTELTPGITIIPRSRIPEIIREATASRTESPVSAPRARAEVEAAPAFAVQRLPTEAEIREYWRLRAINDQLALARKAANERKLRLISRQNQVRVVYQPVRYYRPRYGYYGYGYNPILAQQYQFQRYLRYSNRQYWQILNSGRYPYRYYRYW